MRTIRTRLLAIGMCAAALAGTACGSGTQSNTHGGTGGAGGGGAGVAGSAGNSTGGSGAIGGSGGSGATAGNTGTGGSDAGAGAGGMDASAGSGGTATGGTGGTATGGTGGTATGGTGGTATGGTGGTATGGTGGTATGGTGGTATGGTGGTATGGTGGTATGGTGGTATGGTGGATGGTGGTATGGTGGADAGTDAASDAGADADAAPQCTTNADCDDGVYCDGVETCVAGVCMPGTPVDCNDNITCTQDFCDESTQVCQHVASDQACSNGSFCDGVEACNPGASGADPTTGCVAGTPVNCDDGITCTTDSCDDTTRSCIHTPSNAACDDGLYCDGVETCDPVNGAPGTGCVAGTPVNCEDGIACTTDTCDEATDSCDHTPDNLKCDDGVYCNGSETCDPTLGCQAGTPITCPDDGIACTVEACDEATRQCQTTLDSALCQSGQFCTNLGCQSGTSCSSDADCNDNNPCNGVEHCDLSTNPGVCKAGTPVNCNDNIPCTYDQCDPTKPGPDYCTHTPVNAYCNDGNLCNGDEVCDLSQGCIAGTPLDCNDGVACTDDTCAPTLGCLHTPDNANCSDGKVCDGIETCDPVNGCQAGTPPTCASDGIACTHEVCSESAGGCTHVPDNSLCGCGQTCDPTQGCGNWCTVSTCQGKVYQCGDCLDNDGDCKIDSADPDCIGVCDNNETGYYGNIPGQNKAPCKEDCYFDQDTGSGNDDCYWSHSCDPLEVAPNYYPYGSKCSYDPNKGIPGTSNTCSQLYSAQSAQCTSYCGPLVPNGCDCFGCCAIPDSSGTVHTVFLGSLDSSGNGTCTLADVADPSKCQPCTQVPSCLNTCEHCELCLGKTTLPPDCTQQTCPSGIQLCGQPGQSPCAAGYYCVTGCCEPVPQ